MSGICIPWMSMPKTCDDCQVSADCPNDEHIDGYNMQNRPRFCQLVPVPEHGRLGDLDALMQKDNDDYNIALLLTTDDEVQSIITRLHIQMQRVLMGTPTIIPADPVKEEQT